MTPSHSPVTSTRTVHNVIEETTGERAIHRELEQQPWLIKKLVVTCCNLCYVVSHFRLGNEYEADFVVLHGFSGGWHIHFIELEPPAISPFNLKGEFSARMNHAAGQIRRWKDFENRHDKQPYLIDQLRDAVVRKELLWHAHKEPVDSQGFKITDPLSWLIFRYHIIMGRRSHFSPELMARKAGLEATDGVELITYDRLLEIQD